ncbi:MAG TPA: POTRA domain-containing protein [Candidatus Limnocylindria bacterium]|nr:POTRA domain-containing protein [Candidatus Limnocylindria bacterium]
MRIPRKPTIPHAFLEAWAAAWVTGGLAWALLACPCVQAQESSIEGRRIAEIHIVDDTGKPISGKLPALALEPGKPFDFAAERGSLRTLYLTGDYSDIRVTAVTEADALHVEFIVRRNYFNNVVRIEGLKEPPTEPAALAALRLGLGEPFRESALREAIVRLQDALRADGLYLSKSSWNLLPHEDTRQMDITIHVDPGPRARVGGFAFQNQTPYPQNELLRRSRMKDKSELTSARISRASQRLKKFLVNQGYLGAGVLITPGTYDAASNLVPLHYEVTAGPRVRIEVSGTRLSNGRLRKLLPIYAEGAVDEDLLQEGRRNIRDYLQREGYFDADVQVTSHEDAQNGERVISYEIARGDRFRLAGVSFEGNKYFRSDLLSGRLQLQPASFASSGRFSQRIVREDTDSIRALYFSNGFRDVQVAPTVDDNYRGKKGNLFVSFHIVEGQQTRVASLEIEGNHALSKDKLLAVIGSTPGQPYSEADVASDRNNILAMYYNDGFPEAHFQESVSPADAPNRVRLTYQITEGKQIEVSKVLLTGYQFTRPGLIARQVQIAPGGPLREGEVVDTQRRLYNLGVFNRVTIAPQNPNGTDPEKTVVVDTEEGRRYTVGYGGGFEVQRLAGGSSNPNGTTIGASPRGIFEIARSNMFGRAQTLSFKARASTLQYRTVLSYIADSFQGNKSLSLQLTGFADKTQDVNTFTSTRYEGAIQLIQNLSPGSSLLYRYFYRRVEASQLRISPDEVPLFNQPTLVSGFGLTYARDRRDNPGDPKRGTFNTADASVALRSVGSSASFYRIFVQNSSYYNFGRAFVFARSTRFGVEETLDGTTEADVPLPERFFAGGGTSIRGFGLNQAGPRDPVTGFPVGGLALLAFNQELRFPMRLPFVGNRLGGTVFYDAGNVYTDVRHISFAWTPPANNNLSYFSHTVGLGVRYPTPVGPVRVDFGYQLNPANYQATIAPSTTAQTFRLPHFQFFFNIGPIF